LVAPVTKSLHDVELWNTLGTTQLLTILLYTRKLDIFASSPLKNTIHKFAFAEEVLSTEDVKASAESVYSSSLY